MTSQAQRRVVTAAIKQSAAINGEPLSIYTYLNSRQLGDPDKTDIDDCFDSWEEACAQARVTPVQPSTDSA